MYYLTHDNAGHQIFLLTDDTAINSIEEKIEDGAIAYCPTTKSAYFRISGEWIPNGAEG